MSFGKVNLSKGFIYNLAINSSGRNNSALFINSDSQKVFSFGHLQILRKYSSLLEAKR